MTDTPVDPPETSAEPPDQDQGSNHEAAKYRKQARAAEAENATLRGQIETMQKREVEALAKTHGITMPESLWKADVRLADLLSDGQVDPAKVGPAIDAAISSLGLAVERRRGAYVPSEGRDSGTPESGNAWHQFLNPAQG